MQWHRSATWFLLLATFLLWLQTLLPQRFEFSWADLARKHGLALAVAMLLGLGFTLVSEPRFRIFNDEIHLAAVSFSMYYEQSVLVAWESLRTLGNYEIVTQFVGRRPLFFPFFVSLVHTVSGYRADNVFVVNALSAAMSLFIFYGVLQREFDRFWGMMGMVFLASFPVLITCTTSGGFEVFQLLFLLLSFWLFQRFLRERNTRDLERLGLTLVILAQIRYESPLWVLCFGAVLIGILRAKDYRALSYRSAILPFLFLPILWQRRLATQRGDFGVRNGESFFALDRIPANLGHAWDYFTRQEVWYGSVPPVFYLALAGLAYAAYRLWRDRGSLRADRVSLLALLALCVLTQSIVVFSYYWGNLTVIFASRFGILFLPILAVAAVSLLAALARHWNLPRSYVGVAAVGLIVAYWPFAAETHAASQTVAIHDYHQNLDYLDEHFPDRNNLIIFDTPYWYVVQGWGVVSGEYANTHREELLGRLETHAFPNILVIQQVRYEDERPSDDSVHLDARWRLETLYEAQVSEEVYTRVSRVRL